MVLLLIIYENTFTVTDASNCEIKTIVTKAIIKATVLSFIHVFECNWVCIYLCIK